MASRRLKCFLVFLVTSQCLLYDIVDALNDAPNAPVDEVTKEMQMNYHLNQRHHIVKRKSKGGGRGFGFGRKSGSKSKSSSPSRDPYPKQPAHNPAYNPSAPAGGHGAPPAYPGTNSRPGYPGAPPPYSAPGSHPSYPGAPPAYPGGGGHASYPGAPPAYPGGGHYNPGYSQPGYGSGGFGGKGYGNMGGNYGRKGGGLGSTLGAAGFGAVAGTALGAYGGYKMGKMVGSLGRNGHYGYYGDNGRYIRCDPPKNIKVDPETNVTYIPLEEDYDKRCSYFDRRPQPYFSGYTNGAGFSAFGSNPINRFVESIITFSFLESFHLFWQNAFVFAILAILIY